MKIENVDGIIWDLDGTLLDSFSIFERVIADVVSESGHTMPTNDYIMQNYHGSLEESVQKVLGIQSTEELDEIIKSFLKKQERHYEGDLGSHLFRDAVALAKHAASLGIHQLLVTNRAHENRGNASPRTIVAATVLADYIHEVYPGDEVIQRKPNKASTGDWLERNFLNPEKVIVIGDQFVDAQLAINLGARALLVARGGKIPHLDSITDSDKNILIVNNLEEVELTK